MKPEKKKLPPIPNHLKKLGFYHTEPIRRRLRSFENVIWLAFLRGKQAGKEEREKYYKQEIEKEQLKSLSRLDGWNKANKKIIELQNKLKNK